MATSKIYRMPTEDVSSAISITATTGKLKANSISAIRKSGIIALSFVVSNASAVAQGGDLFEGNISPDKYYPSTHSYGGGFQGKRTFSAIFHDNGHILVRNTGESLPANTEIRISVIFVGRQMG